MTTQKSNASYQAGVPGVDSEVFHARRKQTSYLVGLDDLEPHLAKTIQTNSEDIDKIRQTIAELRKDFLAYKRQIELTASQKDQRFESEVRACMNEQLTYVSELQSEMFKEFDNNRKQISDVTWQVAKLEDGLETNGRKGSVQGSPNKSGRKSG